MSVEIRPTPTDEEAAAIVAAMRTLWPTPPPATGPDPSVGNARRWRFSGRWWRQPAPLRRQRPRL